MNDVTEWWHTDIIDMAPGKIRLRGHDIEDLIGSTSFAQMIWLMIRGDMPDADQVTLFECALVAAVDHGPQAPSIATARMAVTCGQSLNGAMASAVNMLDDVHGGAGEQAIGLYTTIRDAAPQRTLEEVLTDWRQTKGPYVPGFGHRFHKPVDPRAPALMARVREARDKGVCRGEFMEIAEAIETALKLEKSKPVPMNIDGATAVIYAELGFEAPLARGLFCLSRSVGILAHAWEQKQQGGRNKGPTPPGYFWSYGGPNPIK